MYDNNMYRALQPEKASLCDEALIHALEQREKTLRDRESEIIVARDKGRAEGMAEAITEGRTEAKIEVGRKMLAANMPLEKIQPVHRSFPRRDSGPVAFTWHASAQQDPDELME